MKKQLTAVLLCFCAASMMAQEDKGDSRLANIDWKEDSIEITTVKDIVRTKQSVASRAVKADHFAKVWGKRGFFNIAYNLKSTMTPSTPIKTGYASLNGGFVSVKEAEWGGSIIVGKNIKLHKKTIANTLCINLDYVGVDINANYYKVENNPAGPVYDYTQTYTETKKGQSVTYHYIPWNDEVYQFSYGMMVGPSITLAPFNYIKGANGLHFLRFNAYYHIGYRASGILLITDHKKDVNYPGDENTYYNVWTQNQRTELEKYNENQFLVGHGLYHAWGINMSWKRIGVGYEHTWGDKLKYKNIAGKSDYGSHSYKFDTTTNRVYLTYRFGK